MGRYIHDSYTRRGHDWLLLLSKGPNKSAGFGNAAYRCRLLGWCEWARDADGNMLPDYREVLTDAGREKLAEWNATHKA